MSVFCRSPWCKAMVEDARTKYCSVECKDRHEKYLQSGEIKVSDKRRKVMTCIHFDDVERDSPDFRTYSFHGGGTSGFICKY